MSESYEIYRKGRLAIRGGRIEEAVGFFRTSSAKDPHFKTFELLGECLMKLGRHAEAVGPLASAVTLNQGVRGVSLLAEAFHAIGRITEARDFAKLALSRDSKNKKAVEILAKIEGKKK
ncbi:hypothetical protein HYY75_05255 [bacterium]|nr:hypothetical protein [bacterium]